MDDEERGDRLFQMSLDRQEERRKKIVIGRKFKPKNIKNHPVLAEWIEIVGFEMRVEDNTAMVQVSTNDGWIKTMDEYELEERYEDN